MPPALDRIVAKATAARPRSATRARTRWRARSRSSPPAEARAPTTSSRPARLAARGRPGADPRHRGRPLGAAALRDAESDLPGEVQPLIMLRTERLADGRVLSRARFETWPTLAALGRDRRRGGRARSPPRLWRDARSSARGRTSRCRSRGPSSGWASCPSASTACASSSRIAGSPGPSCTSRSSAASRDRDRLPLLDGDPAGWRASRPLRREWRLWWGALLALVPPVADLAVYVLTAR